MPRSLERQAVAEKGAQRRPGPHARRGFGAARDVLVLGVRRPGPRDSDDCADG